MPKGVVKCGNCVDDTRRLFGKTFSEIDTDNDNFMEEAEIETAAVTWAVREVGGVKGAHNLAMLATKSVLKLIDHENRTQTEEKISQEEWENYKAANVPPKQYNSNYFRDALRETPES